MNKLIKLLSAFDPANPSLSAREILKRSGLPRSTLFRLLSEAVESGILYHGPDHCYRLGPKILYLGHVAKEGFASSGLIMPTLVALRNRSGESVTLGIFQNAKRVIAEVLEGFSTLRHVVYVGETHPLHQGSAGMVILASLPHALQDAILRDEVEDEREREALKKQIVDIVEEDLTAVSYGQRVAGACAVSAALQMPFDSTAIGSISLVGPKERMEPKEQQLLGFVREARQEIYNNLQDHMGNVSAYQLERHTPASDSE